MYILNSTHIFNICYSHKKGCLWLQVDEELDMYPCSTAVDDVLWSLIYLTFHLHRLFLLMRHFHPQNTEIRAAQIQGNEISFFCKWIKEIIKIALTMKSSQINLKG